MVNLVLVIAVFLLAVAVKFNFMANMNIITKVKKDWFERFWTGSRAAKENLTELGLKYRKQSNLYAIAGLVLLVIFIFLVKKVAA